MSKKIKELELTALRTTLQGVKDYVFVEPLKLDAGTDYEFRKRLRDKKIRVQMVKNSLARKVLGENDITVDAVWAGTTLVCWGGDSVKTLANAVDGSIKDLKKDPKAPDKFKVKGAVADGQVVTFDVAKTLPTRLEAIGDVLSAVLGPGASIAAALTGPAAQLAGILSTIEEKGPAGGGGSAEPAPAAEPTAGEPPAPPAA